MTAAAVLRVETPASGIADSGFGVAERLLWAAGAGGRPWRAAGIVPSDYVPVAQADEAAEEMFLGATHALAFALEAKDPYTWGHSARVSLLGAAMAADLCLEAADIAAIVLGGELHDIGKIGVPEHLLHKPGPLSAREYRRVMAHPVIGERIAAPLLRSHPAALAIVRSHHERVDGRGLPDHLAGDEIPLVARIAAVADAYDAMTSPRPYRSALPASAAVRELEANAGTQFDPGCVRALRASLRGRNAASAAPWGRNALA